MDHAVDPHPQIVGSPVPVFQDTGPAPEQISDIALAGSGTMRVPGAQHRSPSRCPCRRKAPRPGKMPAPPRSEEHTSELHSLMRTSYAVCSLKKKNKDQNLT